MIKGIDISKYQGILNFADVKNNFEFIIIKSTEGNGYVDPQFHANQVGLRATGICLGYYHFARPDLGNPAVTEADWFLKTIGTLQDGEMLCLDYESSWSGDVVTWCKIFLDEVFAKTKCRPLIYLNQNLAKIHTWKPIIDGNYGLWLADYDYNPDGGVPQTQWPTVAIKQYSNKLPYGSLAVDGDVFYGDVNTFKQYGVKLNNTTPTMTQDQQNSLNFIVANNITEGQVRQGWGYITDNIDKTVTDLKINVVNLGADVGDLTVKLANDDKQVVDQQTQLSTANTSLTNANNSNIILKKQVVDLTQQVTDLQTNGIGGMSGWQLISLGINKLFKK